VRAARALAVVAATALALTGCAVVGTTPTAPPTTSPTPSAVATPAPVTAVAIGDSIAIGYGVPAQDAYPLLVADHYGWTLTDLAESAAGFTVKGLNTHIFDDQVSAAIRLHPDVVLIAATRNDVFAQTAALQEAADAALKRLRVALPHARIIGVSALWGTTEMPAQVPVVSETVRSAVLGVGGSWVDLGQPLSADPSIVLADQVHPTVEGQQRLAALIETGLSKQLIRG
jgi:acyl-CoA thioesterase I